jgi:hypothetical protein
MILRGVPIQRTGCGKCGLPPTSFLRCNIRSLPRSAPSHMYRPGFPAGGPETVPDCVRLRLGHHPFRGLFAGGVNPRSQRAGRGAAEGRHRDGMHGGIKRWARKGLA